MTKNINDQKGSQDQFITDIHISHSMYVGQIEVVEGKAGVVEACCGDMCMSDLYWNVNVSGQCCASVESLFFMYVIAVCVMTMWTNK